MTDDAKPYPKVLQLRGTRKRYPRTVASRKQWEAIRAEKGSRCRICNMTNPALLELHHLVPRDYRGDDVADNLVPLCHACHEGVTMREPAHCRLLLTRLSDAEYAYAVQRAGEDVFDRVYGVEFGRWAKYPGTAKSVYKRAQFLSRNGAKFQAAIRDGQPYIRCERPEDA